MTPRVTPRMKLRACARLTAHVHHHAACLTVASRPPHAWPSSAQNVDGGAISSYINVSPGFRGRFAKRDVQAVSSVQAMG